MIEARLRELLAEALGRLERARFLVEQDRGVDSDPPSDDSVWIAGVRRELEMAPVWSASASGDIAGRPVNDP